MGPSPLRLRSLVGTALLAGASSLGAGCESFVEHPSLIDSLRVVAVRTDASYAAPGARPELEMLLVDGASDELGANQPPRRVQVLWIGTCANPSGDIYYSCYPTLHRTLEYISDAELAAEQLPQNMPEGVLGFGTRFRAQIPIDAISSRETAVGVTYPYGVVYAFFAACAGELRHVPGANVEKDYPVGCFRPGTNEALGHSHFEFGYYPIYVYDQLTNQNPVLSPVSFGTSPVGTPCTDATQCTSEQVCGSAGMCIPAVQDCTLSESKKCPAYTWKLTVDPASVEPAVSARVTPDNAPLETLWVNYFGTAGLFDKDARIVHDSGSGWAEDYGGLWRPHRLGNREVRLFAVVRDNRGGVTWISQDVAIR